MKFVRKDVPTIMDGLVVRYKLASEFSGDGEISASRNGVCISGYFPVMSEELVLELMAVLHKALIQHRHIERTDQALIESSVDVLRTHSTMIDTANPLDHPLLKA